MLDGRWRAKVEQGLDPVGRTLHHLGVSADGLTLLGLAAAIGTAVLIAQGHLLIAVAGLVLTGAPDILDGTVARHSGRAGARGAFFDSVCDRLADSALLAGVAWHLRAESDTLPILVLAVVALSLLVSYERAKAESLGLSARGGMMERAERMVLLGVGLAFDVLVPILWALAVLTGLTAAHRFVMVWRQASPRPDRPSGPALYSPRRFRGRHRRPRRLSRVPGRR